MSADAQGPADDIGTAPEAARPVGVADHCIRTAARSAVPFRCEPAAQRHWNTEQRMVVAARILADDLLDAVVAGDFETARVVGGDALEDARLLLYSFVPAEVRRRRDIVTFAVGDELQLLGRSNGQRAQQDC